MKIRPILTALSGVFLMFTFCSQSVDTVSIDENRNLSVSLTLPCSQSAPQVSSASVLISASDMDDTLYQELQVSPCKVSGLVRNIPSGLSRKITINVYDSLKRLLYTGSAEVDIEPGKEVNVQIKLQKATGSASITAIICDEPSDPKNDSLIAYYKFDSIIDDTIIEESGRHGINLGGILDKGVNGYGLKFTSNSYADLGVIIPDGLEAGTIECHIKMAPTINKNGNYFIVGNDGTRASLIYKGGKIVFAKNHTNQFKFVTSETSIEPNVWYHLKASWGNGMQLLINDKVVASNLDSSYYQASPRDSLENVIFIGKKSSCCMEGIGIYQALDFEGTIDELKFFSYSLPTPEIKTPFILDSATVAIFDFDGNSVDRSGKYKGVVNFGTYTKSPYNQAIQFAYNNYDYKSLVRVPHNSSLMLSQITMEALVYVDSLHSAHNHIIDKSWSYGMSIFDNKLICHFSDAGTWWFSKLVVPQKQWVYLAASYDGKIARVFLNGKQVDSTSYFGKIPQNTYNLAFGNADASTHDVPLWGKIDAVKISNRAISPKVNE